MTAAGAGDGQQPYRRELVLADLDRCTHGRHVRDLCFECRTNTQGVIDNMGNPNLDQIIGYSLGGKSFTVRDLLAAIGRTGERDQ